MKHILTLISLALILTSCGGKGKQSVEAIIETGDLKQIRLKRGEIVVQQQDIAAKLKQLDEKIAVLDSTKKTPLITTFTVKQVVFNLSLIHI